MVIADLDQPETQVDSGVLFESAGGTLMRDSHALFIR